MPTIDIPDKICPHCNGTLWYYTSSAPNSYQCSSKRKTWMKNWRSNNSEHVRKYKLNYDKTEKGKAAKKRRSAYAINELRDYYVRAVVSANPILKLSKEDIPQKLIDIEKKNLALKRELKLTSTNRRGQKILNIPDKVCSHCGDTKWRIEKYPSSNPNSFRYRCVNQSNEWSKKSREKKLLYA